MANIVSVHSFRGGTGKSNTTANLAVLLALAGRTVGVIDTDIQSPGIHILFGLAGENVSVALNDYLWHGTEIDKVAIDVTTRLGTETSGAIAGRVYLIPSSIKPGEIKRVLREGYDAQRLTQGLRTLVDRLGLDFLLIDTHPGLNEETLLSLVLSHTLLIVMRPDQQDYEGTGITVKVARQLDVPRMMLVVNKTPPSLSLEAVKTKVEATYHCETAAVLPHSDEMMELASTAIFVLRYPNHPVTKLHQQFAARIQESG
jgi:MinD-like ATPase involved in chromosome partitioning or flagellar assembly